MLIGIQRPNKANKIIKTATTEAITVATILFFFTVCHPFLDFHDYITFVHKMQ